MNEAFRSVSREENVLADAITLLKNDHAEVKKLFRQFEAAGPGAHSEKGRIISRVMEILTVRTYVEDKIMYPEVRRCCHGLTAPSPSPSRSTTSLTFSAPN